MSTTTEHLMQCGRDVERFFGLAPNGLVRVDEHGWLGLSGELGTADLNMAFIARTAPASLVEEYAKTIADRGLNAILIVDEDAQGLIEAAAALGLNAVGNVPVMVWEGHPAPKRDRPVRRAHSDGRRDADRREAGRPGVRAGRGHDQPCVSASARRA